MLCLVFFAFTTILGWDYYSERCLEYLSGGKMKSVRVFRWIYIFAVFIGPYMTVSAVWTIADIFNGLMALPNMIALFALSGVVAKETKNSLKNIIKTNTNNKNPSENINGGIFFNKVNLGIDKVNFSVNIVVLS